MSQTKKEKKVKEERTFSKKLKLILSIEVSLLLVFSLLGILLAFILLYDKNRSSFKGESISYSEIVKKNYCLGYKDVGDDNTFTFKMSENDINTLLKEGVSKLDDKYIKDIYYESKEDNHHIFYVDLKHTFIKSRVVIDTVGYVSTTDPYVVNLHIASIKRGKINYSRFLKRKGYLSNSFVNDFFISTHLPISYDESKLEFKLNPLLFLEEFPSSKIGDLVNKISLENKSEMIYLNPNLIGLNINLSYLKSESYSAFTPNIEEELPNIYNELHDSYIEKSSTLNVGDTVDVYSLSLDTLNKMYLSKLDETYKVEEISSSLLGESNKVRFSVIGVKSNFVDSTKLKTTIYYSLNGYIIDISSILNIEDNSLNYIDLSFELLPKVNVGSYLYSESTFDKDNYYINFYLSYYSAILNKIKNINGSILKYNELKKSIDINLSDMNDTFTFPLSIYEKKVNVNVSNNSLDFTLTRTI